MINAAPPARPYLRRWLALGSMLALLLGAATWANAQGLVKGVQEGAAAGNKAAGPVGGVLGGAIGGVVGVFTGVLGVGNNNGGNPPPAARESSKDAKQQGAAKDKDAKSAKPGKGAKATKEAKNTPQDKGNKDVTVLTQPGTPQLTAEQIVANSDSYIERIKTQLNLTPDQEKHWYGFSSAMHYLGHNGAERLNLRVARAKRDPPDDIIEQMRNEAQFLIDRAADQRNVADAAEPLYSSLDDKQKQVFIQEMVHLSHERGLD
ncbi:Spy/CpxP family protein refolding chaperone [Bradyrhizobium diversitatis]|uniref:Spy/CpxP family protein refolding chaperone n=1 Tax=Bradyrhizobium diversitatis TaxID=2755406 RepID=A0ABS0P251_9BRAD|nr:Spy/CpxP family protein refolding chaperone [Bradyrhizobium diversitatis]MBH5387152.1 Spy/CpxP family protein refolding chaperone [Bradyrhizobium diversitatis]